MNPTPREVLVGLRNVSRTFRRCSASFLGEGSLGSRALSSSWLTKPSSGCQTILRFEGVPTAPSLSESPSTLISISRLPKRLRVSDSVSSMTLPPVTEEETAMGSSTCRPKLRRTVGLMPGSVRDERYSRIISSPTDGAEGAARFIPFQLRRCGVPWRGLAGEYPAEGAGEAVRRLPLPARERRPGVPAFANRPELKGARLRRLGLRTES